MENHIKGLYERNGIAGPNLGFGDWLCYEENRKDSVAVCYFYYDALLMEKISLVLDKPERAKYYAKLKSNVNNYYKEKFIENGEFKVKTQTGYLLPLAFDMLEGELRNKAINELKAKIIDNDYTLATGFVGTGLLNQTLSKIGLDDEAYSLLLQTKDPSWLYSVRQGATTVWERWNSYTIDKGFGDVSMNSFNHYAYGAVAEWMFAYMAGIMPDENNPGFKKFMLAPTPDTRKVIPNGQERITGAKTEFESAYGLIRAEWFYENGKFTYKVTIPEETEAKVEFPLLSGQNTVTINDLEFSESDGFKIVNGKMVFTLPAGEYIIK
jgi:alpha-L-rhamnosidase